MGVVAALIVALSFLVSFLFPETNSLAEPIAASLSAGTDDLVSSGSFQVLQDTTRRRPAGTMSRRARALEKKRMSVDTTDTSKSLARILEAIKALPRDSSARLAFGYVRRDEQVVNLLGRRIHSLYLPDPLIIRTQQALD